MTDTVGFWVLLALALLTLVAVVISGWRRRGPDPQEQAQREALAQQLQAMAAAQQQRLERLETELRREVAESSRGARQELQLTLTTFQEAVSPSRPSPPEPRTPSSTPLPSNCCNCAAPWATRSRRSFRHWAWP